MENKNDFYIGWMPQSPALFATHTRKVILGLIVLIPVVGIVLGVLQRKFSTASFEYGQLTEITGTYFNYPVPSIKVVSSKDIMGNNSFITIPLTGYGKFGAEGTIAAIEKEKNIPLDKKEITVKGTLLYSDGKTFLQIDKNDSPITKISGTTSAERNIKELGEVDLSGEVLDPKCYFGVMKPGHGKPHRDCAIRCIAGGMSPVFYVRNEKGEANYYLILGEQGEKINDELKDFVADPISIHAKALQCDDWVVLYVNPKKGIVRTSGLSLYKSTTEIASCTTEKCTK